MKSYRIYWELMKSTFLISALTLGGGYVIVPLLKQKFVDEKGWIEEEEVLNMIAVAQSAPGAMAVNASFLLGYEIGGILGAMATIIGTVAPPLLIIGVISVFYSFLSTNPWFILLLTSMRLAVIAIILDVVLNMIKQQWTTRHVIPMLIMVLAFISLAILHINIIYILISAGGFGWLFNALLTKHRQKEFSNESH